MSYSNVSSPNIRPLRPKYSFRSRASHTSEATAAEASISRDLEYLDQDVSYPSAALDEGADSDSDLESLQQITSNPEVSMVGSYKQPSLAGAGSRAFLGTADLGTPRVPSKRERIRARKEEQRLLETSGVSSTGRSYESPSLGRSQDRRSSRSPQATRAIGAETQPLLGADKKQTADIDAEWETAVLEGRVSTTWQREARFLVRSSLPLIAAYLLQYSLTLTSVFTVGHLGTIELGAASLASVTANITGYAAYYGLSTALDTLNAQAYGSGKKALVGLQLQRMVLFLWAITIPIGVIWFFADLILLRIVPEQEVAMKAGLYLKILLLGAPAFAVFECTKRYLQAQGIFTASLYILLIIAPLNALLNWLFVWVFKWGFVGAPIAVAISDVLLAFALLLYVRYVGGSECWPGFTKQAFKNWAPMVKLALPGWLMVEAEVAAFEILTLASSYFGEKTLAAQSVLATIASVTWNVPYPISIASSTRIANLIGATLAAPAKTQARVLVCVEAMVGVLNLVVLLAARNVIAKLFTNDAEVTRLVASVVPLLAAFQVFDAQSCTFNGILRGLGKPSVGGYTQLFCYYLVAMPISMGTAFGLSWGLKGLWLGVAIALFLVASIECIFVYRFDSRVETPVDRSNSTLRVILEKAADITKWQRSVEDAKIRNESG